MKPQRNKAPGRAGLVRVSAALVAAAGLVALGVRPAAADGRARVGPVSAPAGVVRLIDGYLAAKSAHSPDRAMSFFDPGNTTYVNATLGWKFPTWESLKALFSKYMPQWPAGARSYQTEVLGDDRGAVVFFTDTPQEFGHEIRGDSRCGHPPRKVRAVGQLLGRPPLWRLGHRKPAHPGVEIPVRLRRVRAGNGASPEMTAISGELSADFARHNSGQAARLFAPDAVLQDLTLHTAIVGRQSIAAYLARALPSLPYGQGAQVRHVVGGPPAEATSG